MVINHLLIGMILQVRPFNLPSLKSLYHPLLMHLSNWREKKQHPSLSLDIQANTSWCECWYFFWCVLGVQSYLLRHLRMYRDLKGDKTEVIFCSKVHMKEYSTAQLVQEFLHLVTEFAIYNPLQCQVPIAFCLPHIASHKPHAKPKPFNPPNSSPYWAKDDDIQVDFAFSAICSLYQICNTQKIKG